jgi:hypothetical protein
MFISSLKKKQLGQGSWSRFMSKQALEKIEHGALQHVATTVRVVAANAPPFFEISADAAIPFTPPANTFIAVF